MSLATWRAEFMPIDAEDCPEADALAHSRRKWNGLTEEMLKKHGLVMRDQSLTGRLPGESGRPERLIINAESCALCHYYFDREAASNYQPTCLKCPLQKVHSVSCDGHLASGGRTYAHPWGRWSHGRDPQPMIDLLARAK